MVVVIVVVLVVCCMQSSARSSRSWNDCDQQDPMSHVWRCGSHRTWLQTKTVSAACLFPYAYHVHHCVSKNVPPVQLAVIFITYTVQLRQFLAQMLPRNQAIKMYFIFPPHLTSASALPGETGNPEIASFHLNVACFFTKRHETRLKISPGQSRTTLHCQNNRLDAPDRT